MHMPVLEEKKLTSPQATKLIEINKSETTKLNDSLTNTNTTTPATNQTSSKMNTVVANNNNPSVQSAEKNSNANVPNKVVDVKPVINPTAAPNQQQQNQNKNQNNNNNNNNKNINGNVNNNQNKNNNNNNQANKPNNNTNNKNNNNNNKNNQNNNNNRQNNNKNSNNQNNNFNNRNDNKPKNYSNQNGTSNEAKMNRTESKSQLAQSQFKQDTSSGEKKFTGRCRLFVGNLPSDITEQEFKEIFAKYGETGEVFLNAQRSFGFIKLDTRINAEHAKQDLDGYTFKGRSIRVRFASHGAAVRVKNLSPFVSNELLEQAFSIFGPVERAVVIVDDKGRSTGEGIVEFERKPASVQCLNKCTDNCFLLTSYPKPVIVEPLEQKDDEDGLPDKSIIKTQQYTTERESEPHFAANNSFELKLCMKWRELYDLEKKIMEESKKRIDQAREMLEYEIEQALMDHKTMKLKEDLRAKQEELQRIEDMRKSEYQRRQDMEMRRQEEMAMLRKQGNSNQQYDQGLLNQPHQQVIANTQSGGNNRRGNNQSNNNNMQQQQQQQQANNLGLVGAPGQGLFDQNNMQFQHTNQALQQLPPAQQQALIAAQLSFAMAAAAQQSQMFDNSPMNNSNNNHNNNHGNKPGKDDHRGSNSRRQFDRRGGNNNNNNHRRDDSYPGYDNKRARY